MKRLGNSLKLIDLYMLKLYKNKDLVVIEKMTNIKKFLDFKRYKGAHNVSSCKTNPTIIH